MNQVWLNAAVCMLMAAGLRVACGQDAYAGGPIRSEVHLSGAYDIDSFVVEEDGVAMEKFSRETVAMGRTACPVVETDLPSPLI
jgi:hypothetical protein